MKINKIIIVFIAIFLILLVRYSINIENYGDKIVVGKQGVVTIKTNIIIEIDIWGCFTTSLMSRFKTDFLYSDINNEIFKASE